MFFVGMAATDIYVSSLPQMVKDFATIPTKVNLTLSVYFLGIAFSVLFVGEVSNRFGRRRTILSGVLLFSIASLIISIANSLELIILMRFMQSIGAAIIVVVPRLLLRDCMDEREQIAANGVLLMGLIISPAIAPVIGAFLAKYWGWRSCFLFSGILSLIFLIFAYKIVPETNQQKLSKFHTVGHYLRIYKMVLSDKLFWIMTIVYACGVGAYFAFIGISSYLYIDHWHITPAKYATLYFWLSGAYFAGNQIMQILNKKSISPINIIAFGVYSSFVGLLIVIVAEFGHDISLKIMLTTFGVLFIRAANALINPPTQIRIMKYFNHSSAQALGLNMCIGFGFSGLATFLVSFFIASPLSGLIIVSGMYIVVAFITFISCRGILNHHS
jgi:DHA1 family bicyclomycin/chloramphenicol resistance-like MFS transporter